MRKIPTKRISGRVFTPSVDGEWRTNIRAELRVSREWLEKLEELARYEECRVVDLLNSKLQDYLYWDVEDRLKEYEEE